MRLMRSSRSKWFSAFGDCDNCGHSLIYHLPLIGCTKCSCDEYE